jgi:hypothetical protein
MQRKLGPALIGIALVALAAVPLGGALFATVPAMADDSDPTARMTQEGVLVLEPGEDRASTSLMSPDGSHAYIVSQSRGSTCPAAPAYCDPVIVKVRMSDFTRVAALPLTGYGGRKSFTGIIAPSGEFGYFAVDGDSSNSAHIIKVDLAQMTQVATVALPTEKFPRVSLMSPDGAFASFVSNGANTFNPGRIARLELEPEFRRLSAATLPNNRFGTNTNAGAITANGAVGYVGAFELTTSRGGQLIEVELADGITFPSGRILALEGFGTNINTITIDTDPDETFLYVGTNGRQFLKVQRSDLSVVGALPIASSFGSPASAVIDPDGRHVYLGTTSGFILKILLRDGDAATGDMRIVGSIRAEDGTADSGRGNVSAAIQRSGEFAVFGRFADPGRAVRVRSVDPSTVCGRLVLPRCRRAAR